MPSRKKEKKLRKLQRLEKKVVISFDTKDRKKFLTGFRKRKLDRRIKGQEEVEKLEKEERRKQKEARLAKLKARDEKETERVEADLEYVQGEDDNNDNWFSCNDDESGDNEDIAAQYDCDAHIVSVTPFDLQISSLEKAIEESASKSERDNNEAKRQHLLAQEQKRIEKARRKKIDEESPRKKEKG